jgi:beta-mannosidase
MASMGRTCISEPDDSSAVARGFSAVLNVSNETWETVRDEVVWQVHDPLGRIVADGSEEICAAPFSSCSCERLDLSWIDPYEHHLFYCLKQGGQSGTVLFVPPKHYHFADPKLQISVDEAAGTVTVTASAYAKGVEICAGGNLLPEDNFFDMEPGSRTVKLTRGNGAAAPAEQIRVRSVFDIH